MREYMPMLVPHQCAGALTATGQVTGTHYVIKAQGTWVYLEDLPGLLAERRAVCPKATEPHECFFEVRPTSTNKVAYTPWAAPVVQERPAEVEVQVLEEPAESGEETPSQEETEGEAFVPFGVGKEMNGSDEVSELSEDAPEPEDEDAPPKFRTHKQRKR